jgi:hypothetical protein
VPSLPSHIPAVNQTYQWIFTLGQIPPILLMFALAVKWCRQDHRLAPLLTLVGGGLMLFVEPVVDRNGLCWFPTHGAWIVYTTYGIAQPLFLVLAYLWFFGGQTMVIWRLLDRGMPAHRLWKAWAIVLLVDILLEHPGLYMHLFLYYGHQPFAFTKFPLWWGFVNGTTPIVGAVAIYKLLPRLRGVGQAALLVVPILADALVNAGCGLPVWNTINTRLPAAVVWTAGAATLCLCAMAIWFCTLAVGSGRSDAAPSASEPDGMLQRA